MFKKVLAVVISMVMLFTMGTQVFASNNVITNTKDTITDKAKIMNSLKELEKDYNVTFFESDTSNLKTLKFKDVNELKNFLESIKNSQHNMIMNTIDLTTKVKNTNNLFNHKNLFTPLDDTIYNDSYTITWWSPYAGGLMGLASWDNVAFNYKYKFVNSYPQFVGVYNINSYCTGLNIASWYQTNASYNIGKTNTYNDTAFIKVQGYYLLGVKIGVYDIGAKVHDEWNCSLRIQ